MAGNTHKSPHKLWDLVATEAGLGCWQAGQSQHREVDGLPPRSETLRARTAGNPDRGSSASPPEQDDETLPVRIAGLVTDRMVTEVCTKVCT